MKRRDFMKSAAVIAGVQLARGERPQQNAYGDRIENWVKQHPRLYFTPGRMAGLRRRLSRNASLQARWAKLRRRADELVEARLLTQQDADSIGGSNANYPAVSSQVRNIGMTLGLAWRMTGEERYARKLREALLNGVGFERWISRNWLQRTPSWRSGLWTSSLTVGCAAGYDALHEFLSAAERQRIAEGVLRLGILPLLEDWVLAERRVHALDSMGHNYFCICSAGAGIGALALLGEDPRAPAGCRQWKPRSKRFSIIEVRCCSTNRSVSTTRALTTRAFITPTSPCRNTSCSDSRALTPSRSQSRRASPSWSGWRSFSSTRFTPRQNLYWRSTSAMTGRPAARLKACDCSRHRVFRPTWRAGICSVWLPNQPIRWPWHITTMP